MASRRPLLFCATRRKQPGKIPQTCVIFDKVEGQARGRQAHTHRPRRSLTGSDHMSTLSTDLEKTFSQKIRVIKNVEQRGHIRQQLLDMLKANNEGALEEFANGYELGISRRELSRAFGVDETTIRRMEQRVAA